MGVDENFTAGLIGSFAQSAQATQQAVAQRAFQKEQIDLAQKRFKLEEKESELRQRQFQQKVQSGEFFRTLAQALMGGQQGAPQAGPQQGPPAQGGLRGGMVGQPPQVAPGGLELGGINIGPSGPSFSFKQSEPELPPGTSQEIAGALRMIGLDPTNPASYTPENLKAAQDALTKVKQQRTIPQIGQIPPGMELIRDPKTGGFRLEAIPGGPVEKERGEKARARATISGFIVRDARAAREFLSQRPNIAARLAEQFVPGTPSFSLAQRIESLKSTVAIDQLLSIKRQGAGLGQVPQAQLELLARLMGQLSLTLPTEELDSLIQDIENTYLEVLDRMSEKDLSKVGVAQREQQAGKPTKQKGGKPKNNGSRPKVLKITPVK